VEIKGPNQNSYLSSQSQLVRDKIQLQTGQILKAVVISIDNNKLLLELIEPKVSLKLEAPVSSSNLKLGQIISLQVAKQGNPLALNVLDTTNALTKSDETINAALRAVIPKQSSINQLLSNLHYLSIPSTKLNDTYPQEVLDLSRAVFQRLPAVNDMRSATGVKNAINASGIFLEQQLYKSIVNNSNFNTNDTRTSLLRLAESIRSYITDFKQLDSKTLNKDKTSIQNYTNTTNNKYQNRQLLNTEHNKLNTSDLKRIPTNLDNIQQTNSALNELLRNIESSLAKIQFQQLQHFVTDDQSKSNWFLDLPLRREDGSDIFHFHFTKDNNSQDSSKDSNWSVTLTFNLEKLGQISIQIYLKNDKIGATIWAKNNDTYQLFNQQLSNLQQQLENSGIRISSLSCNNGEIIAHNTIKTNNLLDEQV